MMHFPKWIAVALFLLTSPHVALSQPIANSGTLLAMTEPALPIPLQSREVSAETTTNVQASLQRRAPALTESQRNLIAYKWEVATWQHRNTVNAANRILEGAKDNLGRPRPLTEDESTAHAALLRKLEEYKADIRGYEASLEVRPEK